MNVTFLSALFFVLLPLYSVCGDYLWQAELKKINDADYYNIVLPPQYIAKLQKNYADLRILDSSNVVVPYFIPQQNTFTLQNYYVELPIIINQNIKQNNFNSFLKWRFRNGFTRIVVENESRQVVSDLHVLLSNSDVEKVFWLSGSDDNEKWFSIKNKFSYRATYFDQTHSQIQLHGLPKTNYRYYELIVSDAFENPIEIKKIGYYGFRKIENSFAKIADSAVSFLVQDTNKSTVVSIQLSEAFEIDKIIFRIKRPRNYYRKAYLYELDSFQRKKEYIRTERIVHNFTLSSQSSNEIYLSGYKGKTIYLRVANDDNPSLKIEGVDVYTFKKYATAFLEKGSYRLFFGNSTVQKPIYDIEHFRSVIPDSVAELIPFNLRKIETQENITEDGSVFGGVLLWAVIAIVAALLLYVSKRLLSDMKSKQDI